MGITAAVVGGVAGLGSAIIGSNASQSAANTQASAANNATNEQSTLFNIEQGELAPYRGIGKTALGDLGQYLNASENGGPGGAPGLLHQFGAQDLNANLAPNYQFQLGQGQQSLANQNAATGGAGGGNAFAGEQAFTQNTAASAYQNAYNNYNNNQQNIYSRLGNLAQLGQNSATNSATGASAFGGGIANTIVGSGNAQAAGTIGSANAITGGLNNAAGYYMLGNLTGNNSYSPGSSGYNAYNNSLMGDPTSSVENPPT